ncbi:MAG: hypothetical protein JWO86_3432 [Myxococcaceae bacterium]|nr:hypothetical protein [Myxococcaceae bacterium]MEA2746982.1 hypothetical protein [Myxococcales bacterium]
MKIRKALAAVLSIGLWLTAALTLSSLFVTRPAFADAKTEATAKALQKKAMDEDYLATDFAKAADKLEKAVAACGADKCSAAVRAQLHRDLGVVQIGGQIDKEKGIGHFVTAIKTDPATALDPDLRTKDLDAAFAEAKKRAAGGGGAAAPAGGGAPAAGGQPAGDFVHEPVAEQQIRTPIPVYAEYGGEEQLVKVIARYKGFGMTDWKTVELKKMGEKGWGGLLPCADVQQGTTQYYIQGFNAANDPVAVGGDRNNSYKVKVKREAVAEPPHLPSQPAPTQCADTGDCPPNFPGCKKAGPVTGPAEVTGKDGGEFCEEDTECKSKECKASKCTDFEGGGEGEKKVRRVWVGVSLGFDYTLVPSESDVCALSSTKDGQLPLNGSNYYCVNSDGTDYPFREAPGIVSPRNGENARLVRGTSDKVSGGGAFGNIRVLASVDYAVTLNILLGARLGYVLNTYPGQAAKDDSKSFPPVHLELRGTYLFGQDALLKKVAPFVMVGGGVSTFETAVKVSVVETNPTTNLKTAKDVDAWQLAGPIFMTFGGGARVGLSDRAALMLGARVNLAFGNAFAPSFGPDVGIVFGF